MSCRSIQRCCTVIVAAVVLFSPALVVAQPQDTEHVAHELANPNTPLATMTVKFQWLGFEGARSDGDGMAGQTLLIQPVLPFALRNGDLIFFRPAIPVLFRQPIIPPSSRGVQHASELGDVGVDLAYGRTYPSGVIVAGGLGATFPTATSARLDEGQFALGPELVAGRVFGRATLAVIVNPQWNIAGSRDTGNVTQLQPIVTMLPGRGWNVGTSPALTYDSRASQWVVPANLTVGRTVRLGSTAWKLGVEVNYFIVRPGATGTTWMLGFNAAPVVQNFLATMFR